LNHGTGFYPWTIDWTTVIVGIVGGLGLYIAMRQGRIERSHTDRPDGKPLHSYAGIVESASRKPTVFIWALIVIVVLWVIGYVVNIAANGLGY
jgi:hypothetical protein